MKYLAYVVSAAALILTAYTPALAQRSLGLDVSAWQGDILQTTWNGIHNTDHLDFAFIRSSRGGTTGFYNQSNSTNTNPPGQNTLSQRYDDPYFVQNINRATAAGMLAGAYHFGRMDIIASTPYAGGIANNGTDEAAHFIQMAGPFMRPGYLTPVFDFEAGSGIRTPTELAQFAIDFSQKIYNDMGIRPAVYIGGNYASPMNSIALGPAVVASFTTLWNPIWPSNPNIQGSNPSNYSSTIYGPWDNAPNPAQPWAYWQYTASGDLQSYNGNLDLDVAHGDIEFVKDSLVPAVWMNNNSGQWTTQGNWNSGVVPTTPPTGPGQVAPASSVMPTPRLPGAATTGINDTVILDRPTADITVTLDSGTHNIRKLYAREALNITGGSLTINYVPPDPLTYPATYAPISPISAQFSAPVSLSGGSFSAHTLQVDAGQTFAVSGGLLTLNTIKLNGSLSITNPALDNISNLRLSAGATLNLNYSGTPDTVNALYIDGVAQATGTWGALGSLAEHKTSLITGTGLLQVQTGAPPQPTGPGNVLDDFETDEGHFGWAYNLSPQTVGLAATTAIDRVTTEHQHGAASQLLNLVSDGSATWTIRHDSGIGSAAQPGGNVPLAADGYVGFWLKTDDAGITVRLAIDDPVSNTAIERGLSKSVVADNQWHLYQWNFDDNSQWQAFAGGANNAIDNTTVTIDSIFFAGAGNAQIYLDMVSHNPLGLLGPTPVPGDYNGNGVVGPEDYDTWRASFGQSVTAGTGADGNGDGVVDGGDYAVWRDLMTSAASAALAAVPEPASLLLVLLGCLGLLAIRQR